MANLGSIVALEAAVNAAIPDNTSNAVTPADVRDSIIDTIDTLTGEPVVSQGIKQYVAVLNQSGTDDPVATVLVNTLGGDVVWTRSGPGGYFGNLTGAFTVGKTTSLTPFILNGADGLIITMESNVNSFQILTYFWSLSEFVAPTSSDSILNNTIINIVVYP